MPHSKSAKKRHKQSEANRLKNRSMKSTLKTLTKKVRDAAAGGNAEAAQTQLQTTASKLDRAASKGIIHPNAAARQKSRLAKAIKAAKAKAGK